ncbi:hypothetical protein DL770_003442 [Monosporascus sp. CRB-9-2]|nr:hypothetical protein DL770_003442 [Monosporascus sp. CRB-9-2]
MRPLSFWPCLGVIGVAAATPGVLDFPDILDFPSGFEFDWDTITPSAKLSYHDCYGEFRCARLLVPLDWTDPSGEHEVAIAMIKLPAAVADDDPSFGGTIFTNPGGPGASGVLAVLQRAHTLRDITDGGDSGRYYEILSWDPRGVLFTTPQVNCYGDDLEARHAAEAQFKDIGPLHASFDVLKRQHARAQGFGKLCEQSAVNGSVLPFLSTPSVVRDMVEMVDRIQELRQQEAGAAAAAGNGPQKILGVRGEDAPRIQFWGFSYGSVLGNAFASMYPGRVGRMILDGIADAYDYMSGTWLKNLQDTEEIVKFLYKTCFEAGEKCALRRPSDTKWTDMKERVDALVNDLDARPVSIVRDGFTSIITGSEVLNVFRPPLYGPELFPIVAQALVEALDNGNFTRLLWTQPQRVPRLDDACGPAATPPNGTVIAMQSQLDVIHAVMCGDGGATSRLDAVGLKAYVQELMAQSPTFGAYWARLRLECSGWTVLPAWRFTGPFTTPEPGHGPSAPAAPLLFVSARLDPVTPLRNAYAMSQGHPGSAVLEVDHVGHSGSMTPSNCTAKIIREYLATGRVPENGTRCATKSDPWDLSANGARSAPVDLHTVWPVPWF